MSSNFHSAKKCSFCGQWSHWNQQPTDTCQHCGALLDDDTFLRAAAKEIEKRNRKKRIEIDIIQISPNDTLLVRIAKRIVQMLQITFIAIVSFIIWFLTLLAG